jgi:hypothetical protein
MRVLPACRECFLTNRFAELPCESKFAPENKAAPQAVQRFSGTSIKSGKQKGFQLGRRSANGLF